MLAQLPSVDVAAAAKAYADFGGLLVGFAFAALFFYLTRDQRGQWQRSQAKAPDVKESHVTLTVLYAMAALAMTSFLYANLAGEAVAQPLPSDPSGPNWPPAWAVTALLPYGVAFGLSVLMLFYGLTLIMLERSFTGVAGWSYWMVACVGPAVVLRFLLDAAAGAREADCLGRCGVGWPLSRWGVFVLVAVTAVTAAALMLGGLNWDPVRGPRDWLRDRPAAPAVVLFVCVAVMTALVSLYFTGRQPSYRPPLGVVTAAIWVAVIVMVLFAVACGCAIGPRVDVAVTPLLRELRTVKKQDRRESRSVHEAGDPTGEAGPPQQERNPSTARDIAGFILLLAAAAGVMVLWALAR